MQQPEAQIRAAASGGGGGVAAASAERRQARRGRGRGCRCGRVGGELLLALACACACACLAGGWFLFASGSGGGGAGPLSAAGGLLRCAAAGEEAEGDGCFPSLGFWLDADATGGGVWVSAASAVARAARALGRRVGLIDPPPSARAHGAARLDSADVVTTVLSLDLGLVIEQEAAAARAGGADGGGADASASASAPPDAAAVARALDRVLAVLDEARPHVAAFTRLPDMGEGRSLVQELAERWSARADWEHHATVFWPQEAGSTTGGVPREGVAVIARYTSSDSPGRSLSFGQETWYTDPLRAGATLVHIPTPQGLIDFTAVRFGADLLGDCSQAVDLLAFVNTYSTSGNGPVVVVGDFRDTPPAPADVGGAYTDAYMALLLEGGLRAPLPGACRRPWDVIDLAAQNRSWSIRALQDAAAAAPLTPPTADAGAYAPPSPSHHRILLAPRGAAEFRGRARAVAGGAGVVAELRWTSALGAAPLYAIQPPALREMVRAAVELRNQNRHAAALGLLDAAERAHGPSPWVPCERGYVYLDLADHTRLLAEWELAQQRAPDVPFLVSNLALAWGKQGDPLMYKHWRRRQHELEPTPELAWELVHEGMLWHTWEHFEEDRASMMAIAREQIAADAETVLVDAYSMLHFNFTLAETVAIARVNSKTVRATAIAGWTRGPLDAPYYSYSPAEHERIRVGYVSFDFRNHAVGVVIQSMFGMHDRTRIEAFCLNANDGAHDALSGLPYEKIRAECEHWVDLPAGVEAAADVVHALGIDILVDIGVFTAYHRMDLFVPRPAPASVTWLGLGTGTGAAWMDYVVADVTTVPEGWEDAYVERPVKMPHTYHISDHRQIGSGTPPERILDRSPYGVRNGTFLFCNMQGERRWEPTQFGHWCDLVRRVNGSALLLKAHNDYSKRSIADQARQRGLRVDIDNPLDSELVFLDHVEGSEHLRVKTICDLVLDALYYNSHSNGLDLLWAGVPMITIPSETLAGRASASFLETIGLPELIVRDWDEWSALALRLAQDSALYADVRRRTEEGRLSSPLFDTRRWVRNWENALEQIYARIVAGLPPATIVVQDQGPQPSA